MIRILFIIIIFFANSLFSTSPPRSGIIAPEHFIKFFNEVQKTYFEGYFAKRFEERRILREKISKGLLPQNILTADTIRALNLLGKYADSNPRYTREQFQQKLFDGPNPTGTITDYYREVSYNQLYFTGYCTNWYEVPGTMSSYVGSDNGLSANGGPRFVLDLIKVMDSTFNFADFIQYYDNQGNPRIGFVSVVHTGAGAEAGANNIWSHRWNFRMHTNGQPYVTNDIDSVSGKYVLIDGDYAIQPELAGSNNQIGELIEIGVFTHEYGHIFGLPDLYDTDNSSEGLGNWCLMAGGSWGGNGNTPHTPVHMSAWCKKQLGWITPIDITSYNPDVVIPNVENNPVVYRMWRMGPINKEYFLIENRQKVKFDRYLYNNGLLIFHVDDNKTNNRDENHYKVDLEQADGRRDLNMNRNRGDSGDPFPGSTNNTRFDVASTPNSNDYNNSPTYVSVRNIRLDSLNVIATFDIGTQPYVLVKNVEIREATNMPNRRIEPGEYGTVTLTLKNIEQISSPNTNLVLNTSAPDIIFSNNQVTTSIDGLNEITITLDSAFLVSPQFDPQEIYFVYTVQSGNNIFTDSTKLMIGIPNILLYSRGDKPALSQYYFDALNYLNKKFEFVENDTPKYFYGRNILIVYTGKNKDSLFTQDIIDSIKTFIDNGGNLFISGQNFAEFMNAFDQNFLHNYLGISYIKNASLFTNKVYGKANDHFGKDIAQLRVNGIEGASNEVSMDIIESRGDFNVSLTFKTDGSDATGGWRVYPSGAKLFYLGFGFESINDSLSTIKRNQIFEKVYEWFTTTTSVEGNEKLTIFDSYELGQNYPNPFNAGTKINFSIPKHSNVKLVLYNSIGQEIKVLINEVLAPGNYQIYLDGKDLASGVYYYKLTSEIFTSVKKMILLK